VLTPLNVLVIPATVPRGSHYLVDTIAGLAVAAVSILLVRKLDTVVNDGVPYIARCFSAAQATNSL
jgi:hypothetical protein